MGESVDRLHAEFVASPRHYENLVDPDFGHVGVGVVVNGDTIYVSEVFMQPMPTKPAPAEDDPPCGLLAGGLESQVASVLVHRADHDVVKLSQSNIAELVGVNRSSVNRVLKRLEEQKLLLARYGEIQILDKASLGKIAGL